MSRLYTTLFFLLVSAQSQNQSDYIELIEGSRLEIEMIYLPGGGFQMGSPANERGRKKDEGPIHDVFLSPFWVASHETTWDMYELFLNRSNETRKAKRGDVALVVDAVSSPTTPYVNYNQKGFPVINITQYAASQFCKWLTAKTGNYYRLPTEAEWEYASRGGGFGAYSFGNNIKNADAFAWHGGNSDGTLKRIKLKRPNQYGLYDMPGNASEWVLDSYDPKAYIERTMTVKNPIVIRENLYPRVVRGGSYKDSAHNLRSASRGFSSSAWKKRDPQVPKSLWWHTDAKHVGFRIVRPLTTPNKKQQAERWIKPKKEY